MTADNTKLDLQLIDLEQGRLTLSSGQLVSVNVAGYKISDPTLVFRPPLDLHMSILTPSPDSLVLNGIYKTVLRSLRSPNTNPIADRIRIAVGWFVKAWYNATIVENAEQLVFLKIAFEALTGTSNTWEERLQTPEALQGVARHDREGFRDLGVVAV